MGIQTNYFVWINRETIPTRASISDFDLDPPITSKGLKDAFYTGKRSSFPHSIFTYFSIIRNGLTRKESFFSLLLFVTSTSLYSNCDKNTRRFTIAKQTENSVISPQKNPSQYRSISRIEPGLFECTAWYTASRANDVLTMPKFMTTKELLDNKYPIEKNYSEQMNLSELSRLETELEFYERSHAVTSAILQIHEKEYIDQINTEQSLMEDHQHILFVGKSHSLSFPFDDEGLVCRLGHAPTLETCTRKLCGGEFRPKRLDYIIRNVDFLTVNI